MIGLGSDKNTFFSTGDNKFCILHCFIKSRGKLVGCRGNVQRQLAKTSQGSPLWLVCQNCARTKFEGFPSGLKLHWHLFCPKAFKEDWNVSLFVQAQGASCIFGELHKYSVCALCTSFGRTCFRFSWRNSCMQRDGSLWLTKADKMN